VRWTIVGYMAPEGADAVIQTCRDSLDGATTWDSCVVAAPYDGGGVDTVARYTGGTALPRSPAATSMSSGTTIAAMTSHAVQVDPDCPGAPRPSPALLSDFEARSDNPRDSPIINPHKHQPAQCLLIAHR
jgi:hypothetical protein